MSVFDGQTLPDLNNATKRFVRGNTTSGGTGGSLSKTTSVEDFTTSAYNLLPTLTIPRDGHTHTITDISPPYYDVVWIMRVR
jgi:hypothetical protein